MIGNKKKYVKSSLKLSSWFKKKKKKLNIKAHLFYNLQVIMNSTDSGESLGLNLKENTLWHKKRCFYHYKHDKPMQSIQTRPTCTCTYRIYIMYMVHMDLGYLILQNFLINQHCFICKSLNCFPFILLDFIKKKSNARVFFNLIFIL